VFKIVFNKRQGATDDDPRRPLALPRFVLFIEFAQQAMSVEKIKIPHLYIAVIIRAERGILDPGPERPSGGAPTGLQRFGNLRLLASCGL
jgi:hypothetical protein